MADYADTFADMSPRIVVLGVGGAGGNAVNNMIASDLAGVEFAAANTDAQALSRSRAGVRIQMGQAITAGLGAGARPEIGAQAAEDSLDEIMALIEGANMLFITAGMGGGTGTGGAPVIARAARAAGVLTVAVVTKPFDFEGKKRFSVAEEGIAALEEHVDTLIAIPNQNLFRIASERTTFAEAFHMADEVLHSGVRGITDLMTRPGVINLDFADVRTVMNELGKAMMGTGQATGERRALEAAQAAVANPLLDDMTLKGAKAVLINITGGDDLTLYEVDEAANEIRSEVDPDANIIVGSARDETLDGAVRVSVVATGIAAPAPVGRGAELGARAREARANRATQDAGEAGLVRAPTLQPAHTAPHALQDAAAAFASQSRAHQGQRDDHDLLEEDHDAERDGDTASPAPDPRAPARARADSPPEAQRSVRPAGGFSLFGRRRRSSAARDQDRPTKDDTPPLQPAQDAPRQERGPAVAPPQRMVDDEALDDADLEIPAFLRRQTP